MDFFGFVFLGFTSRSDFIDSFRGIVVFWLALAAFCNRERK
jgi:hypothetical protein